jgi:FPC/CPF motif-containing protein YcgG
MEVDRVARILAAYTQRLRGLDPVSASLHPLVLFLESPPGARERDHFDRGWTLLGELARIDQEPWPPGVSRDPEDPSWSFCFGGVPLFVTFKTPAHRTRQSRRLGAAVLMLFQARVGFDSLAGDTPRGRRARARIRRKLEVYDGRTPSAALAHYGTPANREWKQYFIPDGDAPLVDACPWSGPGARPASRGEGRR